MAGSGSTVKVTFLGDSAQLDKAAKQAQASLGKVADSVGRAAKVGSFLGSAAGNLAGAALGKVKDFATGAVDAFAAVEDATGAAGVQFGTQLPSVLKFADEAASSFGLSKRAALDAQNTFGTLGKAAGLTGPKLSGFSQDLTGLAGNLASFKGTTTEQAIEAVGAALRGESEPIRAYGVLLNDASIQAEGLALGLVKPVINTDKLAAAHLRVKVATMALAAAQKEHGKSSIEAQKAAGALASATTAVKTAQAGSIGPLSGANKTLAVQSLILKQTKDAQGDYARTSKSTANVQKTLAAETENAQAKLGQKLAPALTAVRQLLLQGIRALSGFATVIAATSGFVDKHSTALKVVAGVMMVILLPTIYRVITGYIATAAAAVASAARQAAAWLMVQARTLATVAILAVSYALTIAGWVAMGVQATLGALRMAAAWLIAMGPIALVIAAVVGLVVVIVKNWDTIKKYTVIAFNAVWGAIKSVFSWVKGNWPLLLAILTGPIGLAVLFISKHWDSIIGTIKGLPGRISSAASGMWDGIKDAFRGAINWIIRAWNNFSIGMPSISIPFGPDIPGFSINTPNISELANGTRGARGGMTLVGERGPELVDMPGGSKVTSNAALRRGGSGGDTVLHVNFVLDGRVMQTELLRLKRTLGGELGIA